MANIPQEIIDSILDKLDIVDVVSEYIQLKKTGRSFKACCPFHNEKTPSFVVSQEKQIYHCFGCSAGGNAINFVMKYENMGFPEAVKKLAAQAGVELPKYRGEDSEASSVAAQIYEINKLAATFFQNNLRSEKGKKAFEYLKSRGVDQAAMSEFRIGYAPAEWEALRKYCETKKIPAEIVRKAGLTIPSEKGKRDYDRFRDRITFPVFNEKGSIVAFGGRVMDASLPKYINSPETPVYSKSSTLYGLNFSRKGIRDKGYAIFVEGYMDVVIPFQYGVKNIVATSGTALTPRQVSMIKRHAPKAVLIFDADQAGQSASLRGFDVMIENGMDVLIAALPKGEDPDTFVRKNGKEAFESLAEKAEDIFAYKLELLVKKLGAKSIGPIVDEMLPTISKLGNEVIKSEYLRKLAERLGIHEASLRYEMGKVKPDYSYRYEEEAKIERGSRNYRASEIHLLGLAVTARKDFEKVRDDLGFGIFRDPAVRYVLNVAREFYSKEDGELNAGKLLSRLEGEEEAGSALVQALAKADITEERDKALVDCVFCVKKENKEEQLKDLMTRLKEAQASNDQAGLKDLVVQINKIHKEKVA